MDQPVSAPRPQVTSIRDSEPVIEHHGTVPIWDLLPPDALREQTEGGFLELICEMHIDPHGEMGRHHHPTHEYYYVIEGEGTIDLGDETRRVGPGDLIYTPPDVPHAMRPDPPEQGMRVFVFAIGLPGAAHEERERN
jgi:quercetin dioxygenase-like cupin family protein